MLGFIPTVCETYITCMNKKAKYETYPLLCFHLLRIGPRRTVVICNFSCWTALHYHFHDMELRVTTVEVNMQHEDTKIDYSYLYIYEP